MKKKLMLAIVILLCLPMVIAVDRQFIFTNELSPTNTLEFQDNDYIRSLQAFEKTRLNLALAPNSTAIDSEKGDIQGEILFKMKLLPDNKQSPEDFVQMTGNDIKVERKAVTNAEEETTSLGFVTEKGKIKVGDYVMQCLPETECSLKIERLVTKNSATWPTITIKGEAEVYHENNENVPAQYFKELEKVTFMGKEITVDGKTNTTLLFYALPKQKESSFNGINLISESNVLYSYSLDAKISIIEVTDKSFLKDIPNDQQFLVHPSQGDKYSVIHIAPNGKKLVSVKSGTFSTYTLSSDYSDCVGADNACILIKEDQIKVRPNELEGIPMFSSVYPNKKVHVVFDRINPQDPSITLLDKKYKQLEFNSKEMEKHPTGAGVFSFKTDFTAMLYSEKDNNYHEFSCYWKQRKCYYDGKLTIQGVTKLKLCDTDNDCRAGEICSEVTQCDKNEDWCTVPRCIKTSSCYADSSTNGPGTILFLGDGYEQNQRGKTELKQNTDSLMQYLHTIEPFDSATARSAFSLYYMDLGSLPQSVGSDPVIGLSTNYEKMCEQETGKNMKYVVTLSKGSKTFRAFAHNQRGILSIPVSVGGATELDKRRFVHEFGHLFADLADEYFIPGLERRDPQFPNCAKNVEQAREWLERMSLNADAYGNFRYRGCGGDCAKVICSGYIRPSKRSIMNDQALSNEFNEPSKYAIREELRKLTGIGGII